LRSSFYTHSFPTRRSSDLADYALLGKLSIPKTATQNFSGGELTRLKLARLFSNYHEGLLIDEPTTHLDKEGRQFLLDELVYYYGDRKSTRLNSSHDSISYA